MRKVQTTKKSDVYGQPCSQLGRELASWSLQKRSFAFVLQWIRRSKQPARRRISSIQNQLWEKISLIMKNRIDDDGSIEAVLQCRLFDTQNYRA